MTMGRHERRGSLWQRTWPCWLVVIFAALALVREMPGGWGRAVVALPIAILVPGALTLGAWRGRRRIDWVASGFLSALLGVLWFAFASLILFVAHVLITAGSTFVCLLALCVLLAIAAQLRISTENLPIEDGSEDIPVSLLDGSESSVVKTVGYHAAAVAGGILLLVGGTYSYVHGSLPAPADYTWIAWSGPQLTGVIAVGPAGASLPFTIEHHAATAGEYRLTATWGGPAQPHSLANPVTLQLAPEGTVNGRLSIPAPPGGCTYRLVVTLTQLHGAAQKSWFINADVRQRGARLNVCAGRPRR
jgi:hypothetical protein